MERAQRVAKLEALLVTVQKNAAAPRAVGARTPTSSAGFASGVSAASVASASPSAARAPAPVAPPVIRDVASAPRQVAASAPPIAAKAPSLTPASGPFGRPTAPVARPTAPPLSASRQPVARLGTPLPTPAPVLSVADDARASPVGLTRENEVSFATREEASRDGDARRALAEPLESAQADALRSVETADSGAPEIEILEPLPDSIPPASERLEAADVPAEPTALAAAMASFRPQAASPEAAARVAAASRPPEPARALAPAPSARPAGGIVAAVEARPIVAASTSDALAPAKAERSWGRILLLVALWTIAAVGVAMAYLSTR